MSTPPLDPSNIQADVLVGLPKKVETYYFLKIKDDRIKDFQAALGKLIPLITSAADALGDKAKLKERSRDGTLVKLSGVNIAFSKKGLDVLNISDDIGDTPFDNGMINDKETLNDRPDTWDPAFKDEVIHFLVFITGDSHSTVDDKHQEVKVILGDTVRNVKTITGHVRPRDEAGHEHFGYLDGISEPSVQGFDPIPDPSTKIPKQVKPGVLLLGHEGDAKASTRPAWSIDGSFLVFRLLKQNVPEFQKFVDDNNPADKPKDWLGSRLVGRWKSGAPIDLTPEKDDPTLAHSNDFSYDPLSQTRCPFAAHTRKTTPRSDLFAPDDTNDLGVTARIWRRGIPYGPELSKLEKISHQTTQDRGLLFKCFQSSITNGFQFIQHSWVNTPTFPFDFTQGFPPKPKPNFTSTEGPGIDALIGQTPDGLGRTLDIEGGSDPVGKLDLPAEEFVVTKGGEYFFSPSLKALKTVFIGLGKEEGKIEL